MMAAGINYNNVWAALGYPLDVIAARQRTGDLDDFHIGGSEGSGIVWALGEGVSTVQVGDEVVLSGCRWNPDDPSIQFGTDAMLAPSQRVWGYEDNFGAFAQFTVVSQFQCHPKPERLSWAEAACFLLSGATAYRQLTGWHPNVVRPGDPVLIWGGAGGLGSMACQITALMGGLPIAVVSSPAKAEHCISLGAIGTIDRTQYSHWGALPDVDQATAWAAWSSEVRRFGSAIWEIVGSRSSPAIVFEHPGGETLPTSMYVAAPGGMVVICGATSGYMGSIDIRVLWMKQKRLQGSHFANLQQCRAVVSLVDQARLEPCLGDIVTMAGLPAAHQSMLEGNLSPGNAAVLIGGS